MKIRNAESAGLAIARNTTLLLVVTLAFKALGFLEKVLLASRFGTGPQVEAYLIAFSVPFGLAVVLRDLLEPALLPVFVRLRDQEGARAWRLVFVVSALLVAGAVVVALLAFGNAERLAHLLAPGFQGRRVHLSATLIRWLIPSLLFLGVANLTGTILHADKRFVLPAVGDVVFRGGPVAGLLSGAGIAGLVAGVLLGALGKLVVQVAGLRRYLPAFLREFGQWEAEVQQVGQLAAPLSVGLLLAYVGVPLVENAFASTLAGGSVASLTFARKIAETLGAILPYTLGVVAFPYFAQMVLRDDAQELEQTLHQALRAVLFFYLPITVGVILLRVPLVQLLFQRGAFGAQATQQTAWPLLWYAVGLLPMAIEPVLVHFFFAQSDTVTPIVWDVISFVVGIALTALLIRPMGAGGIALATSLAKGVKVVALLGHTARRFPTWRMSDLARVALRLCLAAGGLGAVLLAISTRMAPSLAVGSTMGAALYLLAAGLAGGVVYLALCWALGVRPDRL